MGWCNKPTQLLHNLLNCNKQLSKWEVGQSNECPNCSELENIFHLLYLCDIVKHIWHVVQVCVSIFHGKKYYVVSFTRLTKNFDV